MKILKSLLITILLGFTSSASAVLVDFKAMGDGALGYGESAWQPLNLLADFGIDVDIKGVLSGNTVYAYLDASNAGLGVCGNLTSTGSSKVNMKTGSGTNLCNPSSDDNVTANESLLFTFNQAVTIDNIWFNNNHDPDASLTGDTIDIGGLSILFGSGDIDPARSSGSDGNGDTDFLYSTLLSFNTGDTFSIAYNNEEFYLSAINISAAVPEPVTLVILGFSLIGLGFTRHLAK